MLDVNHIADRLREDLRPFLEGLEVRAVLNDRYRAFVFVTSPSFEGVDEAERQSTAYASVFRVLDQDEQDFIEFIFTDAPSEVEVEN